MWREKEKKKLIESRTEVREGKERNRREGKKWEEIERKGERGRILEEKEREEDLELEGKRIRFKGVRRSIRAQRGREGGRKG